VDAENNNKALLDRLVQAARAFRYKAGSQFQPQWDQVYQTLVATASLTAHSSLNSITLQHVSLDLAIGGGILVLHIKLQNAGLIIRKSHAHEVVLEAFESSPRSADVLASPSGALEWNFPN